MPSACVSKAVLGRNLCGGVEQAYVLWGILVFYGVSKKGELHFAAVYVAVETASNRKGENTSENIELCRGEITGQAKLHF